MISLLVPCYNEAENLSLFYKMLTSLDFGMDWELALVNDGSKDKTQLVIEKLAEEDKRVKFISLSRNFGKESAMLAGLDYVKGDCVVIMDADLQHPLDLVPEMLEWWNKGYKDVYAKRISREGDGFFRRTLSDFYYKILQKTARYDILENVGDFRLLDRECVEIIKSMREKERNTKALFAWIGFKKKELQYVPNDRAVGASRWNMFSLVKLALDGITSFTTAPLRIATAFGLLVSFTAFTYMIYVIIKAVMVGDPVAGYPTMIIVILFIGGVQLLCLGIMGEYIARIFNESKNRPVYVVEKTNFK